MHRLRDRLKLHHRGLVSIWADPHVAHGLLAAHLDPTTDAASRTPTTIERTVAWINAQVPERGRLLDLGCGPGLYAERLCDAGFAVTGIDMSTPSIAHAVASAERSGRSITYRRGDYLRDDLGAGYDVAVCIYCDVGALTPSERDTLLGRVHRALVPGGLFLFDVFGQGLDDTHRAGRTWTIEEDAGFWSPGPHVVLEERVHFPEARAWGSRTVVMGDGAPPREYVTWDYTFDDEQLAGLLSAHGFDLERIERGLVTPNDFASDDVLFVIARCR